MLLALLTSASPTSPSRTRCLPSHCPKIGRFSCSQKPFLTPNQACGQSPCRCVNKIRCKPHVQRYSPVASTRPLETAWRMWTKRGYDFLVAYCTNVSSACQKSSWESGVAGIFHTGHAGTAHNNAALYVATSVRRSIVERQTT